jgi:hypothetical protein
MRLIPALHHARRRLRCWQAIADRYAAAAQEAEYHLYAGTFSSEDERIARRYATALNHANAAAEHVQWLEQELAAIACSYQRTEEHEDD